MQDIPIFIGYANFYQCFIQDFIKIAALVTLILKIRLQLTSALPVTGIDKSKIVGSSSENDEKSTESDFTKPLQRAEELSFLTLNTRQVCT